MTAEEYIVEKLREYEDGEYSSKQYINKLEHKCAALERDLVFICNLVSREKFNGKNKFELSVWDSYDRDNYDKLDAVMDRFKEELDA